ncbi:hypothetical protein [Baaleninema sp.]|uniref:hypothetical protein n=1 Tax=Baaleninema sp. TaxID=3101197 RepID=UPI003D075575
MSFGFSLTAGNGRVTLPVILLNQIENVTVCRGDRAIDSYGVRFGSLVLTA